LASDNNSGLETRLENENFSLSQIGFRVFICSSLQISSHNNQSYNSRNLPAKLLKRHKDSAIRLPVFHVLGFNNSL